MHPNMNIPDTFISHWHRRIDSAGSPSSSMILEATIAAGKKGNCKQGV